ncbi:predicted protein [Naegleria gruberi]|uniref:Predicted protein n=1 Tax=Naegleria gruberi TaxID=5762 RepID=D2V8K8_NAEGR|nr:uncharacterized protein NAEGRDRAFT_65194 [Naegleria gruberi]EFC46706.1 predicted protein [Naegleria gruberi]|eukprot:XP_002679450.1 predicted protein [Naegleria gruberi strain NEG-M]
MTGSQHISNTYAGLLTIGGIAAYAKKGSTPSLVAGVGLGAAFGASSYLIMQQKHFEGHALASAASVVLLGAGVSRFLKASNKTIPSILTILGLISSYYQINKAIEWKQ